MYVRVYMLGARLSMAKWWRRRTWGGGDLICNRGSKLIGCEVQGTLSRALRRRAEQDRERRNLRPDLPLLPPLLLPLFLIPLLAARVCLLIVLLPAGSVCRFARRAGSIPWIRLVFRA